MGEIDELSELRWANRPLRHMTMAEVQRAFDERLAALVQASQGLASDQIELALDRLRTEIEGRRARAGG